MLGLVIAELSILAALWASSAVAYVWGGSWRTPVGRLLLAMALTIMTESLALIALATGHALPLWGYAVVFGIADLVAAGWLLMLWRARGGAPGQPAPPGR